MNGGDFVTHCIESAIRITNNSLKHGQILGIVFPLFIEACQKFDYKVEELKQIGFKLFETKDLCEF